MFSETWMIFVHIYKNMKNNMYLLLHMLYCMASYEMCVEYLRYTTYLSSFC